MTYYEKMAQRRKEMKFTQKDMAVYLGISQQGYALYEKGKRKFDFETALKIGEKLEISLDDLGLDYVSDTDVPGIIDISAHKHRKYTIYGAVACGDAIVADDHETFEFDDIGADFALRCKGDSMINARIYDGDLVFIRECELEDIRNGEIAAVRIDHYGDCTLKKVFYDNARHRVTLMPCNPDYEPIILEGKDLDKEEFKVLGKAVAFVANL